MKTVHLVHGYNVKDGGANTIDTLRPYFEAAGFAVREFDYGHTNLWQVWMNNADYARDLRAQVEPGDIIAGHSNGAAVASRAVEQGAPAAGLILINAALDADWSPPPSVEWMHVYYNTNDVPVRIARLLPFVRWGDMGRVGYTGTDPRVRSFDTTPAVEKESGIAAHSEVFKHLMEWWGARMAGYARAPGAT